MVRSDTTSAVITVVLLLGKYLLQRTFRTTEFVLFFFFLDENE